MFSRLSYPCFGVVALALAAGSAQATLFSFASDVNDNGFTFAGTAGSGGSFTMTDFSRPNTFTLEVNDDNSSHPTVQLPVEFHANLTVSGGQSTLIAGSLYEHSYSVVGTFGFYDMMGNALLTCAIGPRAGVLTVPGTQTAWSTTGAVLGGDSYADVTYTASAAFVAELGGAATALNYGIAVGSSTLPDDFAFDLDSINAGAIGATVGIDATTKAPTSGWRSQSSFSGAASGGVPAPGACGLAFVGFAIGVSRRSRR